MEQENLNKGTQPPETAVVPEVKHESKQESGKPAQKPAKPKKELTPAEMQKRKKMLIMPLFFLVFGAVLWLIFAPSGKDKEKEAQQAGLNVELPMPTNGGLVSDKRDAYEREAMQQKQQDRMRSLQDFSTMFDQAEEPKQAESNQPEYYENPSARQTKPTNNLQASANAYQDINKQLGSWYEEPAGKSAQELAVEERMNELERKLAEAEQRKAAEDEQAAMLEKSYQMAAKYMPQTAQEASGAATGEAVSGSPTMQAGQSGKTAAQPVKQVRQNVVSLLAAPVSDAEFIRTYSQPRNIGFLTAAGNEGVQDKNSIRACVYQTVTLTNGKEVQIRLLEPMRAGDMLIPANTVITGSCRITGERLDVAVNSIQYDGNIIPIELLVYDMDGQRGVFVPGSDEINAAKEVAATLASSAGTSIMISDNAGSQLAADMGKGLIQGASQYVSKKMSIVKVTLKANYRLLLLPKTQ